MNFLTFYFNGRVTRVHCAFTDAEQAQEFMFHHWNGPDAEKKLPECHPAKKTVPCFDTCDEALAFFDIRPAAKRGTRA
jgi:hypothetical protein